MNVTKLGLKEYTVGIKYLVKTQNKAQTWGGKEEKTCCLSLPGLHLYYNNVENGGTQQMTFKLPTPDLTSYFPNEKLFLNRKHTPENRMPKSWSVKTLH